MRWCFAIALGAVLGAATLWHWNSADTAKADLVWVKPLAEEDGAFGGLSGYDRSGGKSIYLTDRGHLYVGGRAVPLRGNDGRILRGHHRDSEGLALLEGGRLAISFEGEHRVALYSGKGELLEVLPRASGFDGFHGNEGLEALAVAPNGALVTLPERSGASRRPFPIYIYEAGAWREEALPRRGAFLPVGADFGPDGRLYILERDYLLSGFRSRVRKFDWADGLGAEETLLQTRFFTHGNLEGIAVFEERGETFIEMVSDNNFLPVQATELVRYKLIAP